MPNDQGQLTSEEKIEATEFDSDMLWEEPLVKTIGAGLLTSRTRQKAES